MTVIYFLIAVLIASAVWLICGTFLFHDSSLGGRKALRQYAKLRKKDKTVWDASYMQYLSGYAERLVYLDAEAEAELARKLNRAGMDMTPKAYTARKYVVLALSGLGTALCLLLRFWIGAVLALLFGILGLARIRETLQSQLAKRDDEITAEMPRFIRTICYTLRGNRDILSALMAYRKVAGIALGNELDILISLMRSGNAQSALNQFQTRLGTEEVFRLCSTLREIDRGIDQTATMDYLADDMARQRKHQIQKQLATRPAKMKRTYYPAVGICVIMILYVLVNYVLAQFSTIF